MKIYKILLAIVYLISLLINIFAVNIGQNIIYKSYQGDKGFDVNVYSIILNQTIWTVRSIAWMILILILIFKKK
jgi:thiamine transporter ThiT